MKALGVILARAQSRGLADKCVLPLCGRPVISYSLGHAQQSESIAGIVLTTDSSRAAGIGRAAGAFVVERPAELAVDTARVDDAVRHAVGIYEQCMERLEAVVILYGNVPIRADGIIDRCVRHLAETGCDSVRTVAPVGKLHPDWMHRLDDDRMLPFRSNGNGQGIDRRQDLEPLYYHDGAVIAVRRECLMAAAGSDDPHAFFGPDRRAVLQNEEDTVDIDTLVDFYRAEALIRVRSESILWEPTAGSRRPRFTGAVAYAGTHDRR